MREFPNGSQHSRGRTCPVDKRTQAFQSHLFGALPLCGSKSLQPTRDVVWDLNRHHLPITHCLNIRRALQHAYRTLPPRG